MDSKNIIIIGSGSAALCAGIASLEKGASVIMLEKADKQEFGGNSRYTAGAMRFAYNSFDDLKPLLLNPDDERLAISDFGSYTKEKFLADLKYFNQEVEITDLQQYLVDKSLPTLQWLGSHNIKFAPIYSRQTFIKDGKYIFWGGLSLEAEGEGDGLVQAELTEFLRIGGEIKYNCDVQELLTENGKITGVNFLENGIGKTINSDAVIVACGGFEANKELRIKHLGEVWAKARVRGTRHNMGKGLEMATAVGAALNGNFEGCHATPMDFNMPEYGNLDIPFIERKHYRKISYLFGVMLNARGERFVDEGLDFRNYTYAQFGAAVLKQPDNLAWQIFDAKVDKLLYSEYKTHDASFVEADTLEELVTKLHGVNPQQALATLQDYNASVDSETPFDPTIKDGKATKGLSLNKTNWANVLDTPPFKAYPVTGGITFTYGGVKVNTSAEVLDEKGNHIAGLFACGEMVGGVFFYGYPGGSGLTSGAVFGRSAGYSAAEYLRQM
ncbi:FAD-dependent tricarballylate dehydrogenase TcuA [Arcicella sp. LKC2W]|uniref:FAD-dependent tricarballylate dehydrogenase TcuA n=1 Tax=Arcicella sp. LKC2W TaxID=2984198 RepID=UPI002B1F0EA3|nr:FAD-dependent tricarballylate dehydrogenase TcuA [Arcicella sp. LKC2W]MEA5458845.1 FAD-dependent tricarballylate dehydrogenase TcuA [Arcicella sp. LKC2W]